MGSDLTNVFIALFKEIKLSAIVTSFGAMFQILVASFTQAFDERLLKPVSISLPCEHDLFTDVDSFVTFY